MSSLACILSYIECLDNSFYFKCILENMLHFILLPRNRECLSTRKKQGRHAILTICFRAIGCCDLLVIYFTLTICNEKLLIALS